MNNTGAVVVTGICGNLGRRVARRLHRQHEVIGIDRRPFSGKPKDMDGFAGKWDVNDAGLLVLTRDDGMAAECKYTLADTKLTLSDCPAAGAYDKSE